MRDLQGMGYAVRRGTEIFVGTAAGVPEGKNSARGGFPAMLELLVLEEQGQQHRR